MKVDRSLFEFLDAIVRCQELDSYQLDLHEPKNIRNEKSCKDINMKQSLFCHAFDSPTHLLLHHFLIWSKEVYNKLRISCSPMYSSKACNWHGYLLGCVTSIGAEPTRANSYTKWPYWTNDLVSGWSGSDGHRCHLRMVITSKSCWICRPGRFREERDENWRRPSDVEF
jgi:hypothetical protein